MRNSENRKQFPVCGPDDAAYSKVEVRWDSEKVHRDGEYVDAVTVVTGSC